MCSSLGAKFTCFIMETDQSVQSDIEKTSFLWKEFDPSLTSEQCTVCSKFSQQCKGGRPITKTKKRTQHAPKDCDRSELEMSTFVPQAESTPKKMPLSVETKKSSLVPSTSAADKSTPDRSQPKTVEIQCHLQLKVLWRLQLPLSLQKQATLISKKAFHPFN